jgi:hypothetical protein
VKDRARTNPNLYTVGIEHEGHPGDPWPEAQVASSAALVARVTKRWGIACDREHVLMHREIRASKTCPGLNEADMVAIIDRARRVVIPDGDAAVPAPGTRIVRGYPRAVRIAKPVNLRVGTPSVRSPIVTVLPVGAKVEVVAQIVGPNPIEGQSWWYELPDERGFFWAGAVQSSF